MDELKKIKENLDNSEIENTNEVEHVEDTLHPHLQFEIDLKNVKAKKLPELLDECIKEEFISKGSRPSKTMQVLIAMIKEKF